jgi:hypothetical protein
LQLLHWTPRLQNTPLLFSSLATHPGYFQGLEEAETQISSQDFKTPWVSGLFRVLGQSEPAPHQCTNPDGALMDFTFSSHALTANQGWAGITFFRYPPEPDITTDPHKGLCPCLRWVDPWGRVSDFFGKSGSHRFENSWASPAGSHQPVVTYDLQLVQKDKLNFHFFQLKNRN